MAAKVMEKSGDAELDTVAELAATRRDLDLVRGWCKTYKTRMERAAMGLQFVSNAIIRGEVVAAQTAMRALLANDLAEARQTVGARADALGLAISVLDRHDKTKDVADALASIRLMAPEAFGGEVAMTAPAAGKA